MASIISISQSSIPAQDKLTSVSNTMIYSDIAVDNPKVHPNTPQGIFNLLMLGDYGQISSVDLKNLLGEKIYNSESQNSSNNLSCNPSGIYFVDLIQVIK